MKKAIILTILVLSFIITGCIKKTSPALENIGEPTQTNVEASKQPEDATQSAPSADAALGAEVKDVEGTEGLPAQAGWRVYEKPEMNIRLLYHKDWYYARDEQAEKELGYNLYVGFAESSEILEKGAPYPIELIIVSSDKQFITKYIIVIGEKDNKKYALTANYQDKYIEIVNKMAESFEFISETADISKQANESWQVYRNEEFGYEISYLKNWEYLNNNNLIEFREKGKKYIIEMSDVYGVSVSVRESGEGLSIDDWVSMKKSKLQDVSIKNIDVDGNDAVQISDYLGISTQINHDKNIYTISTPNFGSENSNNEIHSIYQEMVNSFKFTN